MKKATQKATLLLVATLMVLCSQSGCSKEKSQTQQPAPQVTEQAPAPAPPKEKVTFKSAQDFTGPFNNYFSIGGVVSSGTPKKERTVDKDEITGPLYVNFVQDEGNTVRTTKMMKIPATVSGTVNLDTAGFETFPAEGWKIAGAPNVTMYVFRSELEAYNNKVNWGTGDDAAEKTIPELNAIGYPVKVVRVYGGNLDTYPDEEVMLGQLKPDGIKQFLSYVTGSEVGSGAVKAVQDEESSAVDSMLVAIGHYSGFATMFDDLPEAAKGVIIDMVVPVVIRKSIAKSDSTIVSGAAHKYLLDVTWQQVTAIDPTKEEDCSWWPSDVKAEKTVAHWGMSKNQCTATIRILKLWARRGQFTFERTKQAVAKELKQPSAAPAKPPASKTPTTISSNAPAAAPAQPPANTGGSRYRLGGGK